MGNYTITYMLENPRRGRQARNFTTKVLKVVDVKSSSEQIFSENWRWVPLTNMYLAFNCTNFLPVPFPRRKQAGIVPQSLKNKNSKKIIQIKKLVPARNNTNKEITLFLYDKIHFGCHCGAVVKELLARADKSGSTLGDAVFCFLVVPFFCFCFCFFFLFVLCF